LFEQTVKTLFFDVISGAPYFSYSVERSLSACVTVVICDCWWF